MEYSIFISLLTTNLLIVTWLIGYRRLFTKLHTIILSILLFSAFGFSLFSYSFSIIALAIFTLMEIIFSYRKLRNLLTPALFIILQNGFAVLTWTTTYDLPRYFLNHNFKLNDPLDSLQIWQLYVTQAFFLIISIFLVKLLDDRYKIWLSLSEIRKKYIFVSINLIVFDIFLFFMRQNAAYKEFKITYYYVTILILLYSLIFIFFVFYSIQLYKNRIELQILYQERENIDKKISLSNDFRHDFKSLIIAMNGYLEIDDLEGAREYLSNIESYSKELINENYYSQIRTIPVPAIQGLLLKFVSSCQEKKIDLSLNIQKMPIRINMGLIDFIRCASILLNNAIDGTTGKIYVAIIGVNDGLRMTVRNTTNLSSGIGDFFMNGYSSKKNHQGIGLNNFVKIIKMYNNVTYTADIENGWITFTMSIN
ncbi:MULTISPECIES: GHKL domain-containing protein [unclassified Enterococcus]|uniref:GHKL domain-containing protein n=1 Tax=unclassified Enterococcus TaxID=2608891 RepID=UPI0015517356|nr:MULTISPECIES: GHKL domain-containing protein [unclassified Enterococcus]MBS7577453.1 GHKL domain-containing protein [Enterococcus sp. MMGLQ5-2]MBS7584859.1 GHKL domain-containing protein [Enterococcus sp. MMGLQ5-1]NPD12714.1 GHKL domain-containing protein [Enterococcus sp. MMGLQ5-1]NPD37285.1 GHKL domain-containing protein [Enterococcus sp. MMGLQ5-2]